MAYEEVSIAPALRGSANDINGRQSDEIQRASAVLLLLVLTWTSSLGWAFAHRMILQIGALACAKRRAFSMWLLMG